MKFYGNSPITKFNIFTSVNSSHRRIPAFKIFDFHQNCFMGLAQSNKSPIKTPNTQHGEIENVHSVSLSKQDKLIEAHEYLLQMDRFNIPIAPHSFKHLLETSSNLKSLKFGKLIHQRLPENPPEFLVNCVLQMYCDCGSLSDARKLFDETHDITMRSWFIIINAYA